jgi:hypothetical protein
MPGEVHREEFSRDSEISGWRGKLADIAGLMECIASELQTPHPVTVTIDDQTGRQVEIAGADSLRDADDIDAALVTSFVIRGMHPLPGTSTSEYLEVHARRINRPHGPALLLCSVAPTANRAIGMLAVLEEAARRHIDLHYRAKRPRWSRREPDPTIALVSATAEQPAGPTLRHKVFEGLVAQLPGTILGGLVVTVIILGVQHFA